MANFVGVYRSLQKKIIDNDLLLKSQELEASQLQKTISCMQQTISSGFFEATGVCDLSDTNVRNITKDNSHLNSFIKCFISSDGFTHLKNLFTNRFINLTDEEFQIMANRLAHFIHLMKGSEHEEVIKRFLNLTRNIRVNEAIKIVFHTDNFNQDLLSIVQANVSAFSLLIKYTPPTGFWTEMKKICRICIEDIDNYLEAFDILTSTPITGSDAQNYFSAYQMTMLVFKETTDQILPSCLSIGFPFLFNAIRKVYIEYFQKTPSSLPPLKEFTDPNFYLSVAPVNNRNDILEKIKQCWQSKTIPILVGEPGCGKTSVLVEVARRIAMNQFGLPGNGYKAFGGSAIALTSAGGMYGGNDHIRRTLTKIVSKSEHTVLLLDEVEAFTQDQKLMLREFFGGPKPIRYAVFATTTAGKDVFFEKDDGSSDRRFEVIHVPNFSPDETNIILQNQARSMASNFIIKEEVTTRIVKHTNGDLSKSRKLLSRVIRKAAKQNNTYPSQEALDQTESALVLAQGRHFNQIQINPIEATKTSEPLNQLEKAKLALEEKLKSEKVTVNDHARLLTKRQQLTYKIIEISQTILQIFKEDLLSKRRQLDQLSAEDASNYFRENSLQTKIAPLVKEFAYYSFWFQPYLSEKIREFEQEHNFVSEITNNFVTAADLNLPS
ncbi:MAG: ATP-binding protein [Parachlamydia sp.]|nr:ATP-binding protein [Parachlamydia sp.]